MKHFNWLVKMVFYQHQEKEIKENAKGVFYNVCYIDQLHLNLCTNACENMLSHFWDKPFATMAKNPRGVSDGSKFDEENYFKMTLPIEHIKTMLEQKGPFILSLPMKYDTSHSIVVFGATKSKLYYHDPLTGFNRVMSHKALSPLIVNNEVTIVTPRFWNKDTIKEKSNNFINLRPEIIRVTPYDDFFTLDKMNQPCDAIINFLKDYTKGSPFSKKHHREAVETFISENENEKRLSVLLKNLSDTFGKGVSFKANSELHKRLIMIERVMRQPILDSKNEDLSLSDETMSMSDKTSKH
jgi:hypothetical protein